MHPERIDPAEVERRFAELARRLDEDPDGLRREIDAELIAKRGRAWFDANRSYVDADWACALELLGFQP